MGDNKKVLVLTQLLYFFSINNYDDCLITIIDNKELLAEYIPHFLINSLLVKLYAKKNDFTFSASFFRNLLTSYTDFLTFYENEDIEEYKEVVSLALFDYYYNYSNKLHYLEDIHEYLKAKLLNEFYSCEAVVDNTKALEYLDTSKPEVFDVDFEEFISSSDTGMFYSSLKRIFTKVLDF